MVQDSNREARESIFQRLIDLLRRTKVVEVPLEFSVDMDSQGRHVIEVYTAFGGIRKRIENVRDVWNYGFSLQEDKTIYVVSRDSLETLLSIRSLNPEVTVDGKLLSEVYPPVLKYLRNRDRVIEGDGSKRLRTSDKPLQRRAEISYDPAEGLRVKTGYEVPGHDGIVPIGEMKTTPDGSYTRFGDTFHPYPDEKDPRIKEWIETQEKIIRLDDIPEFFKRDLVLLRTDFKAVLTEKAKAITIYDEFQPRVRISTGEPGWLDFKVEYEVGKYSIPHDIFKRSKGKYVHPNEYTWVKRDDAIVEGVEEQLKALGAIETPEGFRLEIMKFPSLEDFIELIGGIRQVSAEYQRFLEEITDFQYDQEFQLPPEVEKDLLSSGIELRPYQRAGVQWLNWLTNHHLHGILADDMGLGKTIQMIVNMRLAYEASGKKFHSLIICPRSVVRNWSREIKRVFPEATTCEYLGQWRDQYRFEREEPIIFITTYATAARDTDVLSSVPFFFVVLDEGTEIKNPETSRAKAVKELNAAHRFVLSGTPIENRPAELWSIFDFLMKGHLGTYGGFISKFERPIIMGDEVVVKRLSKRIRPFILRRLKEEVAKDLPEKIEMNEWCSLTEEQRSIYGQLQDMYVSPVRAALLRGEHVSFATSILPILTKLKQVCDHPALITGKKEPLLGRSEKFNLVAKKLQEIWETGESTVLFTHFLGTLDLFEAYIRSQDVRYIRIDGSTIDRQGLIDRFNEGKASVALCSILAAGHGINLIAANHVIHVDRWWNPAVEDQATDRVHRIGQTKTVYVHKILTEGTLEEKIDSLIERKRAISDRVIGAATKGEMRWTREELIEILEPLKE